MDFEIGSILYIVITVVAIIVGMMGKKKKPKGQGAGETGADAQPEFLKNLERAFNMGGEDAVDVELEDYEVDLHPEEMEPEPVTEPSHLNSDTESDPMMDAYEELLNRSRGRESDIILSEADVITEPLEVIHVGEGDGTDYFEVVKDFNAATAVVYSAIINRLDY